MAHESIPSSPNPQPLPWSMAILSHPDPAPASSLVSGLTPPIQPSHATEGSAKAQTELPTSLLRALPRSPSALRTQSRPTVGLPGPWWSTLSTSPVPSLLTPPSQSGPSHSVRSFPAALSFSHPRPFAQALLMDPRDSQAQWLRVAVSNYSL